MPKIYVGTYKKYNEGSLKGEWVDLDKYYIEDDFYEYITKLHADESDPEFMFQDYEGIPPGFVSESNIDSRLWDWLDLNEEDRKVIMAYLKIYGDDGLDVSDIMERFIGTFRYKHELSDLLFETYHGEVLKVLDKADLTRFFDFDAWLKKVEISGDIICDKYDDMFYAFHSY